MNNDNFDTNNPDKNSRRTFIRNSGVALTAALAAASTTAGAPIDDAAHRLAILEDSNAIRVLQQRCFALLEQGAARDLAMLFSDSVAQASCVYPAMQLDSRLDTTSIAVDSKRQSATARFAGRVQLGAPIAGDSTLEQMARMQGINSSKRWEHGTYEVTYVKVQAEWKISALTYHTA
ncbi:MAG: hypothetical protein V4628_14790 [Pseudomonadota bacterium]